MTLDNSDLPIIPTTATIKRVIEAEDRDGIPQWELEVHWSWTNKYDDKLWIYQEGAPANLKAGSYRLKVRKDSVKKKADGTQYDGNLDWMWKWKIVEWTAKLDSEGREIPLNQSPPDSGQEGSTEDSITISKDNWKLGVTENELRIMRQTALKCASWQMVPLVLDFASPEAMVAGSVNLAEQYLHYFVTGEVPVFEVETPEEEPEGPEYE